MHTNFYHLNAEPFQTHPDPGLVFISSTHKEAWYYLLFSMDTQEPFLLLTGEYGMGKTLLCLRLIQVLKERGTPAVEYIATPNEGFGGILQRMAARLGISGNSSVDSAIQNEISEYFRAQGEQDRFYLIIDDAQELDLSTLVKLKQLATFNINGFFPVGIIFVAHPSLIQKLKSPALISLNQRIKRRHHLSPFNFDETKNYIYFRLLRSGASGIPVFSEESLQAIFNHSGGIPRLINNICDTCLLMGASQELSIIPVTVVEAAVTTVGIRLTEIGSAAYPLSTTAQETGEYDALSQAVLPGTESENDSLFWDPVDMEAAQIQTHKDRYEGASGKNAKTPVIAAVVLILMLSGAAVVHFHLKDRRLSIAEPPIELSPQVHKILIPPANSIPTIPPAPEIIQNPTIPVIGSERVSSLATAESPHAVKGAGLMTSELSSPASTLNGQAHDPLFLTPEPPLSEDWEPLFRPFSLRASSYQLQARAEKELAEIRRMGLPSYLVRINLGGRGVWWRVYIGYYANEEEAKKNLQDYKLSYATVQKTAYACQLGEFTAEAEMVNMFDRLNQSDFYPYIIQIGRNRFRLYIGAYEKKSEAESLNMDLLKKGFNSQIVKR